MKNDQKNSSNAPHKKGIERHSGNTSQSQNNIGTVGHISYKSKEGKGSFRKMTEILTKGRGPNVDGIGENQENHSTRLPGI